MSTLVWIHEDSLSPYDPALAAHPGARAVFVWDDESVEAEAYSLKRIVFQYECLLEMPVEIHRGPTVETLLRLAAGEEPAAPLATGLAVTWSVNPGFAQRLQLLEARLPVTVYAPAPFVPAQLDADLRRFARFWKRAEPHAFRRTAR
ncbi:MAG: hypothetical protein MUF01_05910 [Bryobacterales bacterium]|jgi:deoxyribodipyrimidine photo-lyase|nr:hypothetical protein [Bryobacterales bacterium]